MGKIIVITNVTLDGVMQAPMRPDEDVRGSFTHGGWAAPFAAMQRAGEAFANLGAFLFGRRTYEDFYSVWPKRTESPFTPILTNTPKYVVSSTLHEPLPWSNSILVGGDAMQALSRLRADHSRDFVVFGSGVLVQSLVRACLVDEFVVLTHPLVLGAGRRLFQEASPRSELALRHSKSTNNGVVIATYAVKTGP